MARGAVVMAAGVAMSVAVIVLSLVFAARRQTRMIGGLQTQPTLSEPEVSFSSQQLVTTGQLMFEGPKWRERSVRRLEFLSPSSMRAHVSVDFVVPAPLHRGAGDPVRTRAASEPPQQGTVPKRPPLFLLTKTTIARQISAPPEPTLVPLFLVEKRKLASIDLRDEHGAAIPMLSRRDEAHLSVLLLISYWAELFPEFPIQSGSPAEQQLSAVIGGPPADAQMSWIRLVNTLHDLVSPMASPHHGRETAQSKSTTHLRLKEFCGLARGFVRHSHLFAYLQDALPGRRRILKLCFDVDEPWFSMSIWRSAQHLTLTTRWPIIKAASSILTRLGSETPWLKDLPRGREVAEELGLLVPGDSTVANELAAAASGFGRGLLSRLGFTSRRIRGTFSPFRASSEHLVVEAPPGTYFTGGDLCAAGANASPVDAVSRGTTHAHLYCSHRTESDYEFTVRLRARRRGWLMAALLTTAMITALLVFAWAERDLIKGRSGVATAIAAAALGLGTVAVAYLVRPGEHPMTTRLLEGPRLALIASGIAALGGVMLLAVGEANPAASRWSFHEHGWVAVAVASAALAIIVGNYLGSAIGWLVAARSRLTDFGELRTSPFVSSPATDVSDTA